MLCNFLFAGHTAREREQGIELFFSLSGPEANAEKLLGSSTSKILNNPWTKHTLSGETLDFV